LQASPDGQLPQFKVLPQPSLAVPQVKPICAQVFGVHDEQTLSMQVSSGAHEPQFSGSPVQLFARLPQFLPANWQ
jgi:hypothetical protein